MRKQVGAGCRKLGQEGTRVAWDSFHTQFESFCPPLDGLT